MQSTQALPPVPQLVSELLRQLPTDEQHPPGHEDGLHTHLPLAHCWPEEHWAVEPHVQLPEEEQPSASVLLHPKQVAPAAPQLFADRATHVPVVPPTQQPFGQPTASQTQLPEEQCWPVEQGEPEPHWQVPLAEQVSARVGLQFTQTVPPVPHVPGDFVLQVVPEQQPLPQLLALQPLHAPPLQVCGLGQFTQLAPADPQAESAVPGWQAPA